ncbi:MAG: sulfate reduction electron transfer complex DsrMKJOP subunit DsrJ [Pirellulales bacterium]|nr:sulfate reduction electron transfer complex DsrMKJOP subunit DsrJ [Pirellulales bacterium]
MSDKPKIIAGLAFFLVIATFPIWYAFGFAAYSDAGTSPPARTYPKDAGRCIESKEWMVANHMALLNQWRNEVVREGEPQFYHSLEYGTEHMKSLTRTCMECHGKPEMCDADGNTSCTQCHDYANVTPRCWKCHVELRGN